MGIKLFMLNATDATGFQNSNNTACLLFMYLQPIITQYFTDNKSEIWSLSLIAHSKR